MRAHRRRNLEARREREARRRELEDARIRDFNRRVGAAVLAQEERVAERARQLVPRTRRAATDPVRAVRKLPGGSSFAVVDRRSTTAAPGRGHTHDVITTTGWAARVSHCTCAGYAGSRADLEDEFLTARREHDRVRRERRLEPDDVIVVTTLSGRRYEFPHAAEAPHVHGDLELTDCECATVIDLETSTAHVTGAPLPEDNPDRLPPRGRTPQEVRRAEEDEWLAANRRLCAGVNPRPEPRRVRASLPLSAWFGMFVIMWFVIILTVAHLVGSTP